MFKMIFVKQDFEQNKVISIYVKKTAPWSGFIL